LNDPSAHAELLAIRQASTALKRWRLAGSTLYVTLEPCIMCMGASILARVDRIVFGAKDPKGGAAGSLYDLSCDLRLNHRIEVVGGLMEQESGELLKGFFRQLRARRQAG
jgi:tRNA(adenine34) deaminase